MCSFQEENVEEDDEELEGTGKTALNPGRPGFDLGHEKFFMGCRTMISTGPLPGIAWQLPP